MSASDTDSNADETLEMSDVRFGLRGLLVVMTAVAVASGLLGISYRGFNGDERYVAAMSWIMSAAIVIVRLGYCAVTRVQLLRAAGNTLFVLPPRGTFGFARRPWAVVLINIVWIGCGFYLLCIVPLMRDNMPTLPILAASLLISMGIERIWLQRVVRLHVHGVLFGMRLLRWSHVTDYKWDGTAVVLQGIDQRQGDAEIEAVPPRYIRDKVGWLIERMTSPTERSGLQNRLGRNAVIGFTTLVPVNTRRQVTARGLAAAALAYMILCLITVGMMGRSGPVSREYVHGIQLGIALAILKIAYDAWSAKDAGAPLVRLYLKLDWPSFLGAMLVALATLYIIDGMVFPPIYTAMPLGTTCGLAMSIVAGMLFREKLDLCENGIVLGRWPVVPWDRVHVLKWQRLGKSSLLLGSGWRRLRTRVPAEHRGAVDQILTAKCDFGHDSSVDDAN